MIEWIAFLIHYFMLFGPRSGLDLVVVRPLLDVDVDCDWGSAVWVAR